MPNLIDPIQASDPWWKHAVCYQIYVRSFADGNGDGIGDLPGIRSRLPYLKSLGVDAIWVTPFYPSPQHDHGYDVSDYFGVDPLFGQLSDADALIATAHELGLRVIVDIVPNHTSSEHEWFQQALSAPPGSAERARYFFRDGSGPDGSEPPNNWGSVFGGDGWTRIIEADGRPGQWYLHLFDTTQPDLDWRNPEVPELFERVLRFWLDRGVDGFRIDVAHGMFKEASLRDQILVGDGSPPDHASSVNSEGGMVERRLVDEPMWDQPEVHQIYRQWRLLLDSYPGERMAVAEAWTQTLESMARFVRSDELPQTFNFSWLLATWSAKEFGEVIDDTLALMAHSDASPTWVLSNHDVIRHTTRYGGGELGLARARAATLTMLALPGSSYLYQGEELGLEQVEVEPEFRQDPSWFRTGEPGRDGCRVPMPWAGAHPPFGFSATGAQPWLPQPALWADLSAEAQDASPDSTLAFYREALAVRRTFAGTAGDAVTRLDGGPDVLAFRRGPITVMLNCGTTSAAIPEGEVLVSSTGLDGRELPPDAAVWLR